MVTPKKSLALVLLLAAGLLLAEGVRLAWFSLGESPWDGEAMLTYHPPPDAEILDLDGSRASDMLSYDASTMVRVTAGADDGSDTGTGKGRGDDAQLQLIVLQYEKGNGRIWVDMFDHSPEVCLGNSGSELLATFPNRTVELGDRELVFRHLLFQQPLQSAPVHVFKMIWLPDLDPLGVPVENLGPRAARFAAVKSRFLPPGTLTLAIVSGVLGDDPETAWHLLRDHVALHYRFSP